MIIKRGRADEAPRTLARWYASLRAKGNIALAGATVALILLVLGLTFFAGALAHRQGLVKDGRNAVGTLLNDIRRFPSLVTGPAAPRIVIDIGLKQLRKIEAKREEALQRGLLFSSKEDYVNAQLRFEGRSIPIEMRLKGDVSGHYSTDKWSFRIKVKGQDHVLGMRRFSIHDPLKPPIRTFEWAALVSFRNEGILAPRSLFVTVTLNGEDKGVYNLTEFFAKEMLEAQGRRDGVIVAFDEDSFWLRREQLRGRTWRRIEDVERTDFRVRVIDTFASGAVQRNPALVRQRDEAVSLLRGFQQQTLRPSEVFDARQMGRYLAIVELWSAPHGLSANNVRFYYNAVTAKLEPIAYDLQPGFATTPGSARLYALGPITSTRIPWTNEVLEDPEIAKAYVQELMRITSEGYLRQLEEAIGEELKQSLRREWPDVTAPWETLRARHQVLRAIIDRPAFVQALRMPTAADDQGSTPENSGRSTTIQIANTFVLPTEVLGFRVGDLGLIAPADVAIHDSGDAVIHRDERSVVLAAAPQEGPLKFVDFSFAGESESAQSGADGETTVLVLTRLLGDNRIHETPVTPYPSVAMGAAIPSAPTVDQALALHPYLGWTSDPSMLEISPGVWTIEADIVLPEGMGLYIGPGTTLRFAPGAMLLARGPLLFLGTAEQPVILGPSGESWPGVVVLEAEQASFWEHTVVESTHGVERGGWMLTGGITFYKSPITFLRTRIAGSAAEDAVNIIHTSFRFDHTEIGDTVSDAFDGDFTSGVIIDSSFHDIGGDAIDVSGSAVTVQNVLVRNVGDKAISAGESSYLQVTGLEGDNVGIGIASKDSSRVSISNSTLSSFVNAGLAAYTKKPEYGPGSIVATNVTLGDGSNQTLVQTGSWIRMDGRFLGGTDLDVRALYEAGILGN